MTKTPLALAVLALAAPAAAQQQHCAPREHVIERLETRYGETRHAFGLAANGALMEFWANVDTESWTFTVSSASGQMCIIATGENFRTMEVSPKKGDPA